MYPATSANQSRLFFAYLLTLCLTAGCSSSPNVAGIVARVNDSNIKRAANLFGAAIVRNDWRAPKDEADFKEFIHTQMAPQKLEMMGIKPEAIDTVFISERDGKPFRFRYGATFPAMSTAPIVFEQQGVDGVRQVAYNNGTVENVTSDARYQELWNGKPSTPPPPGPPPQENAGGGSTKQSAAK